MYFQLQFYVLIAYEQAYFDTVPSNIRLSCYGHATAACDMQMFAVYRYSVNEQAR